MNANNVETAAGGVAFAKSVKLLAGGGGGGVGELLERFGYSGLGLPCLLSAPKTKKKALWTYASM